MAGTGEEAREKYLQSVVEGASKEELLLMLLDGAIKFMNKAELAFEGKKWDELHNLLCRVQSIFLELAMTLDLESGEFAVRLADIYGFIHGLLVQANVDRDWESLVESKRLIKEIRQMWSETIVMAKSGNESGGESPTPAGEGEPAPKRINITG